MNNFFKNNDSNTVLEAQYEAQKIAFAPIIFQVARSMRDLGIFKALHDNNKKGLTLDDISKLTNISYYGVKVLLETSLSSGTVKLDGEKFFITKTGYFLYADEMTNVNMNYNHYVNYQGLFTLDESIKTGKAIGLKNFGTWDTIYPALSSLPDKVKKSWFEFDHFYSDSAFNEAVQIVLSSNPKTILDIGGNTGKFSIALAKKNSDIKISIMDLPQQISLASEKIYSNGITNINLIAQNVLDDSKDIPKGYDIIWMSQFLDCFSEDDIIKLLTRVKASMSIDSKLYIMEPLWDKQRFETSAFCIINTSPYFTSMANGYSKMFNSVDLLNYIKQAGLKVDNEIDDLGICQNIIICKK